MMKYEPPMCAINWNCAIIWHCVLVHCSEDSKSVPWAGGHCIVVFNRLVLRLAFAVVLFVLLDSWSLVKGS